MQRLILQIRSWVYVSEIFNSGKIVGTFYEKELLKTKQKGQKKVIKEKRDNLYVRWNEYDNSFNI